MVKDIDQINKEVVECVKCPSNPRFQHELGWGPYEKIMFVGQCPSSSKPSGKQGDSDFDRFLSGLLEGLNIDKEDFYFTNLIKIPVEINKIDEKVLDHCATHVIEEINFVKPEVIFCLGRFSCQALQRAGVKVIRMTHPGSIHYGKVTKDQWQNELGGLLKRLNIYKLIGKE